MIMREATWTPNPGELFRLPETARQVAYPVSVVVEESDPAGGAGAPVPVLGYQGVITPEQPVLSVTDTGEALTVSAETLAGLFPIDGIDYLLAGVLERAISWDTLPNEAEEIVAFKASTDRERAYVLAVTAQLADGSEVGAEYSLIVQQDWTAGRDRLKEATDARR